MRAGPGCLLGILLSFAGFGLAQRDGPGSPDELAALLSEDPSSVRLWMQAAYALRGMNQDFSLDAFRTAWRLDPADPAPHQETALILEALGDRAGARPHLCLAVAKNSTSPGVFFSLGNVLASRSDHARAAAMHARACALSPVYMEAHNNLASELIAWANEVHGADPASGTGLYRDALSALAKAVELAPAHPTPLVTCARLAQKTADFRFWPQTSELLRSAILGGAALDIPPWQASVLGLGPEEVLRLSRGYSHAVRQSVRGLSGGVDGALVARDGRVKVGFVSCSGFMGNTTTANFIKELFGLMHGGRFATTCFARGTASFSGAEDGSAAQGRVMRDCGDYQDHTGSSLEGTARAVSALGTHVLVDLTGWTLFPCMEIFALRPAPVQISWHGYAGSLGGGLVDYMSLDIVAAPPEYQAHFDEKMLHTHGTYLLSARPEGIGQTAPQRNSVGTYLRALGSDLAWFGADGLNHTVAGFDDEAVIMCSFNNVYKGDPETLRAWVLLLSQHPRVRLWLMKFDPTPPPNIAREFLAGGVDTSRVLWSTFFPRSHEFAVKSLCGLFLDWPNFNGHTTGAEALWNGVPVLTACTDELSGRVGASLVLLGGCKGASIVARNLQDYAHISHALAGKEEALRGMSARLRGLRDQGTLLCGASWVRSWEAALLRAVDLALSGHPPHHLSGGPIPEPALCL